jgi:hypothetical protein
MQSQAVFTAVQRILLEKYPFSCCSINHLKIIFFLKLLPPIRCSYHIKKNINFIARNSATILQNMHCYNTQIALAKNYQNISKIK